MGCSFFVCYGALSLKSTTKMGSESDKSLLVCRSLELFHLGDVDRQDAHPREMTVIFALR